MSADSLTPVGRGAVGGGIGLAAATVLLPLWIGVGFFFSDGDSITTTGATAAFVLYGATAGCGLAFAFAGPLRRVLMVVQGAVAFGGATGLGFLLRDGLGIWAYLLAGLVIGLLLGVGTAAGAGVGALVGGAGLCLVIGVASPFENLAAFGALVVGAGIWGAGLGATLGRWSPAEGSKVSWEAMGRMATRPLGVAAALAVLLPVQVGAAILGPLRKPPRFCFTDMKLPSAAVPAAAADFDGDGDTDVVQRLANGTLVGLLRNDQSGPLVATDRGVGQPAGGFAAGDLDRDGDVDVAVVTLDHWVRPAGDEVRWSVVVGRNDGRGAFELDAPLRLPRKATALVTADVDGDGGVDVLATDGTGSGVQVLWGRSDRLVLGPLLDVVSEPQAVGDIDGDGRADLFVRDSTNDTLVLYGGRGVSEGFEQTVLAREDYLTDVALGDIDEDGDIDLVFGGDTKVTLLTNMGENRLAAPQVLMGGGSNEWLDMADLDGDGDLDLIASNAGGEDTDGYLSAWENDGAAGWSAASRIARNVEDPLIADLTGDGRADLVTGYGSRWKLFAARDC